MNNRNDIEQLFKANYERMYRFAVAILHDDDLAHDIVHDVFASLLDNTSDSAVTESYLLRAVKNRCLNHIRDCGIHQRVENRYFIENDEYNTEDWPDEETITKIYALIQSELMPQARRVMELRFSDGLQFSKIANLMQISESAVYCHLSNALKTIRQKLINNG
ncbi:MAG: sigma-70 family RNA polymerase sigma factor [Muribaculaceae bacterium]|nr:sigma-70 family RNA polymerase sigma factor [Muribaculaceae bacterium]